MNKNIVVDKLISLIPVWGYHNGKSNGFEEGMAAASQKYEEILVKFEDELIQYNRDVFGKEAAFVAPEGWDEQYWCDSLDYFLDGNDLALTTRQIFFAFTKEFLQKMDKKGLKTLKGAPLTYRYLTMVQCTVSTGVEDLIRLDKSFLEITIDFLDYFKRLAYDARHKELATGIRKLRNEISMVLSSSSACNVLTLGRTGVGKSSLLNYLLGVKSFKTAVGAPQTMGFDETTGTVNNVNITVFDSRGLETGDDSYDYEEFKYELKKFKQKHDVFKSPADWIHAVVYCVPRRYQPVDSEIINSCFDDNFDVVVALTKMDGISKEQVESIKLQLKNDCPRLKEENIVPICSVTAVDREGNKIEPFGREKLIEAIYAGFKASVLENLPKRCVILGKKEIDDFRIRMKEEIDSHSMALVRKDKDVEWFKGKLCDFQEAFAKEVFPEIVNKEVTEVVNCFAKTVLCINLSDGIADDCYEKIIFPAIKSVFGDLLGGLVTTCVAKNVGINIGARALPTIVFSPIPVLNVLLPGLALGDALWTMIKVNDNLKEEFHKALDSFTCGLKSNLDTIEKTLREKLQAAMKQK